jgi:hypothetical protein
MSKSEQNSGGLQNLIRVPFASRLGTPILRATKNSTLRLERYDVDEGEHILLVDADDETVWALAKVEYTFTCQAQEAENILRSLDANHALTTTDEDVIEILQPHYSEPVTEDSTIQGIVWEVLYRFAAVPDAT